MNAVIDTIREVFREMGEYIRIIKISDIVDILIVAFLIYKLMMFLRRTNSARVAKGIMLLVVCMWLSDLLSLEVITFLLSRTIEVGLLALIILFQPELRRLLEQMGSRKITGVFNRQAYDKEMETAIAQTVLACQDMSASKTGALIIFEREIKLDDPIKTGTIINADTTAELLKNMFFNKAPLHDGAVIIRDGRIAAAGCMLPLSSNTNLSRELGMRHRAGIGMSEQSDAVVAIVSEETGSISVAVGGVLKRHLSPDTFEKILRKELLPEESETATGVKAVLRNTFKGKKNDKRRPK